MLKPKTAEEGKGHVFPSFATTHWSVVLAAAHPSATECREALETLCWAYWFPLYSYVRRHGYGPEDAQDLTQEFFHHFLERNGFIRADPTRGRFRTFLLASLKHFLVSEWRKTTSQKHGGGARALSLDVGPAEAMYAAQATNDLTPETIYERRWAMTLIEQVAARLRKEHADSDQQQFFDQLADCVWGEKAEVTYAEVATRFGLSEKAVKSAAYRMRQRCRELLREEVARTVERPEDVEDELRYLVGVLSR